MKVARVMTRSVRTCRRETSLSDAARIMWEGDCGSVPIVDGDGNAIGMITDRDICMAAFTRDLPPSQMSVASVCSNGLVAVRENDSVEMAERLMQEHQVRRLPVTDEAGHPVGMLSLADLARHARNGSRGSELTAEDVVATLAAVGSPRASATAG
jgi:CBS domain-containing protein